MNNMRLHEGSILTIDRSFAFDPDISVKRGWHINEGEEDERSLRLTRVNLSKVRLVTMLKEGEASVVGEEKLERLIKAGYIRLDAKIFQTLRENPHLIPEAWKQTTNGDTTFIYFEGTILRSRDLRRYVPFLYWRENEWRFLYDWCGDDFDERRLSAVLTSDQI